MKIFLDEAGAFIIPTDRPNLVCCVLALVVPSSSETELFYEFLRLRDQWPHCDVEIKGSKLDESKIRAVISLLIKYEAIAHVKLIDMGMHTDEQLTDLKKRQADAITEHLGPEHNPSLVKKLQRQREDLYGMPNQLFVQSFLTILLLTELLRLSTIHFALTKPAELSEFCWFIDAKDRTLTKAEKIWSTLILPVMESESLKQPLDMLQEGDYSAFKPFLIDESTASEEWSSHIEWLKKMKGVSRDYEFKGVDIKLLLKEMLFGDSKHYLGLQLADIVASAFYRAFNGNLGVEGWAELGLLLRQGPWDVLELLQIGIDSKQEDDIVFTLPIRRALSIIKRKIRPCVS